MVSVIHGWQVTRSELLDYRHQVQLLPTPAATRTRAQRVGGYLSRHQGRGMEFVESRHYLPGDDIRAIDWRITARTGKTHTKLFQEEKERPIFIMVDYCASMQFGSQLRYKSVQAAHLAALIGWQAIDNGDRLGALLFDEDSHLELRPRSRRHAVLALINQLVTRLPDGPGRAVKPASTHNEVSAFAHNCRRLRRLLPPGSQVYILSDFFQLDQHAVKELNLICRHNPVTAVEIYDPLEQQLATLAPKQSLLVTDGEQISQLTAEGQQMLAQHLAARDQRLASLPLRHWSIGADQTLEHQLKTGRVTGGAK